MQVTKVAPLRDLSPGSVPQMISSLRAWSDRCSELLDDLDTHVADVQATAASRARHDKAAAERLKKAMGDMKEAEKKVDLGGGSTRDMLARRGLNKRSILESGKAPAEEAMDLDGPHGAEDLKKRASKRKM